eukprot:5483493-Pyramimonas_sp.AAC.1
MRTRSESRAAFLFEVLRIVVLQEKCLDNHPGSLEALACVSRLTHDLCSRDGGVRVVHVQQLFRKDEFKVPGRPARIKNPRAQPGRPLDS